MKQRFWDRLLYELLLPLLTLVIEGLLRLFELCSEWEEIWEDRGSRDLPEDRC